MTLPLSAPCLPSVPLLPSYRSGNAPEMKIENNIDCLQIWPHPSVTCGSWACHYNRYTCQSRPEEADSDHLLRLSLPFLPGLNPPPLRSDTLAWHLHGGLRFGESNCRLWGKGVCHVRIDQLELAKLKNSTIDQAVEKFSPLKILFLKSIPEQVRYEPSERLNHSKT